MVVHHCGFGTAAATLTYGVPSVPVPHVLDQMGFADTLFHLGVASNPLKANGIGEQAIIDRIHDMQSHYQERLKTLQDLSVRIQKEHGLQKDVELIKKKFYDVFVLYQAKNRFDFTERNGNMKCGLDEAF